MRVGRAVQSEAEAADASSSDRGRVMPAPCLRGRRCHDVVLRALDDCDKLAALALGHVELR